MGEVTRLTLPEFAFLDDHISDKPGVLDGRNVILHIRSASVMEVFNREDVVLNEGIITHKFKYKNSLGFSEPMIMALHYSTMEENEEEIKENILRPASKWFCEYLDWEDKNIEKEGL